MRSASSLRHAFFAASLALAGCQYDASIGADDAAVSDRPSADDGPVGDAPFFPDVPFDQPPSDRGPTCPANPIGTFDMPTETLAQTVCAGTMGPCRVCLQSMYPDGRPSRWSAINMDPSCPCPAVTIDRFGDAGDVPPSDATATFACAASTCRLGAQICQHPRPPGICPRPDGGICPAGCPGCPSLPPPTCEMYPSACAATPTCDCLLRALCGSPMGPNTCEGDAARGFTLGCGGV